MRKKYYVGLLLFFSVSIAEAQESRMDTTALMILDKMSSIFGGLKSLGFTSQISKDVVYADDFFIKEFTSSKVRITGPNKFSVHVTGENKDDLYAYNGAQVVYYSFQNNIYTVADAPDNFIETIDWLYTDFNVEFTAADVLYPSFSADFAENMDSIHFLGVTHIDGERVYHIGASNSLMTVQLWISDDAYYLPRKTLITYLEGNYANQFETDFTNWELNQEYPEPIFEFMPPPGARQITWMKKD